MFEKKYKFVFLRKEYSTICLVGIVKTNSLLNDIRFNGKTFHLNLEFPVYTEPKTKIYFIDFSNGSQLKLEELKVSLNPEEYDTYVASQMIKQLTAGAISDKKEKLINMIIGAIMGGLLAALLMFFYMQSKIQEIYDSIPIATFSGV